MASRTVAARLALSLVLSCWIPRIDVIYAFRTVLPIRTPRSCTGRIPQATKTLQAPTIDSESSVAFEEPKAYIPSVRAVTSSEHTSRFMEIATLVAMRFVSPVLSSIIQQGVPSNWNEFWSRSVNVTVLNNTSSIAIRTTATTGTTTSTIAQLLTAVIEEMGPTYVKFGQAMSSRFDLIPAELAVALGRLQDNMLPTFDTTTARHIIRHELLAQSALQKPNQLQVLLDNLSHEPVACASIGQVYQSMIPEYGTVAVKIQRPGLGRLVERDTVMLRGMAEWVESLRYPTWWTSAALPLSPAAAAATAPALSQRGDTDTTGSTKIIQARVVDAVNEFMARVTEELDYRNEASNMIQFANLYSHRRHGNGDMSRPSTSQTSDVNVVVPHVYLEYCTANVLVMEWIDGVKLTEVDEAAVDALSLPSKEVAMSENLSLLRSASAATLSQLFVTGVLHADPHKGNLLKIPVQTSEHDKNGRSTSTAVPPGASHRLGYLDFGMISTVPESVRDGLVCAVSQLVFGRNVTAVVDLLEQLQLLDADTTSDPLQRSALASAFATILEDVLQFPTTSDMDDSPSIATRKQKARSTDIPQLRFDRLLGGLTLLVTQFALKLPPYFLNNARALATLEGIIQKLDPEHNSMQAIYPFAVNRLFGNPSNSPVVERTLIDLTRHPLTGHVTLRRLLHLLDDAALVSGRGRARVVWDVLSTVGGRRMAQKLGWLIMAQFCSRLYQQSQRLYRSTPRKGRRGRAVLQYLRL